MSLPRPADARVWRLVRLNMFVGLLMFIVNSVIGGGNSLDVFGDPYLRGVQMLHTHSATLGWIGLTSMSLLFWISTVDTAPDDKMVRRMIINSRGAWIVFPLHALMFLLAREWGGNVAALWWLLTLFGFMGMGILANAASIGMQLGMKDSTTSVPRLLMMWALVVAALAALMGLMQGTLLAAGVNLWGGVDGNADGTGAHAGTMAVFVGMMTLAMLEWAYDPKGEKPYDHTAKIMLWSLVGAGGVTLLALLSGLIQILLLAGLAGLVALVIWWMRNASQWMEHLPLDNGWRSWMWAGPIFILADIVLGQIGGPAGWTTFIVAGGHMLYVGGFSMAMFAVIMESTSDQGERLKGLETPAKWLLLVGATGFGIFLIIKQWNDMGTHIAFLMALGVYLAITIGIVRVWHSLQADDRAAPPAVVVGEPEVAPADDGDEDAEEAADEATDEADEAAGAADEPEEEAADEPEEEAAGEADEPEEGDADEADEPEEEAAGEADEPEEGDADEPEEEAADEADEPEEALTESGLMALKKADMLAKAEEHGVEADEPEEEAAGEADEPEEALTESGLMALKKADMLAKAEEHGVEALNSMTKQQIADAILASQ